MLQDIFNALASGAPQGNNQPQAGGDVLSSVLGSLMGGQTGGAAPAPASNQSQAGGDVLSSVLGSLMGGQAGGATPAAGGQVAGNPLMNLIGSGQNPMVNMLVQPIVDQIAQKLGIPPQIAMMAVTFAIHYMITNHGTKLANGEDMSGVLTQHASTDHLHSIGMAKGFAEQTGMKPQEAANTLSEVFKLLGVPSQTQ
jgi:hypothetical protein